MKYFIRSAGINRVSLSIAGLNTTAIKEIDTLQLERVGWLRFWLFQRGLINAEIRLGKIICQKCGNAAIEPEEFSDGYSKGLPLNCIDCR